MDLVYCRDCGTTSVHKGRPSCATCGFEGKSQDSDWYSHVDSFDADGGES